MHLSPMSGMSGNTTGIKAPFPLPSTLSLPPHYPLPDLLRPQHAGRQRSEKSVFQEAAGRFGRMEAFVRIAPQPEADLSFRQWVPEHRI